MDLGRHRVICSLPAVDADDLIAACEVLWQEGHRTWAVPADRLDDLRLLTGAFGRRAHVGVEQADDAGTAAAALQAGAAFLASRFVIPEVVAAAGAVPVILGGLTPTELHLAHRAGARAVQVTPVEAFGNLYARGLPELMAPIDLIAAGHLERYQAELWLSAGAIGVWPAGLIERSLIVDTGLQELRARAQAWQLD